MTIESLRMIIDKNMKVIDWCCREVLCSIHQATMLPWYRFKKYDLIWHRAEYYESVASRIQAENHKWYNTWREIAHKELEEKVNEMHKV